MKMKFKILLIFFAGFCFKHNYTFAQTNIFSPTNNLNQSVAKLIHPILVNRLYELNTNNLIWFLSGEQSHLLRNALKNKIDSSVNIGLQKNKYHYTDLVESLDKNFFPQDSIAAMQLDRIFTDAAIAYCKDVYQGYNIDHWISYDEISKKYEDADNTFLLKILTQIKSANGLNDFINSLEPKTNEYLLLKTALQYKPDTLSSLKKQQLATSLNFYRWVHHFNFQKYIVVNIASATLQYFEYDTLKLSMKVLVGKPFTKTPRFAAYTNQVILYPYWNVPASIALKELLPKIKRNPHYIEDLNMALINSSGNIVDHNNLNWKNYNSSNFPFRLRQSTGCDNSLGVIKFNLTSPLGVYLHDTNNKGAFLSSMRYLSHGCIRLEKPIELANFLLIKKIDNKFLEACMKNQVPVPINLAKQVPVFVIYQMAETDSRDAVKYYKDIYGLASK